MALTKVGGGVLRQPIDVGIITATSVNASGIVTAGTIQVGSATTVHTTGIDLGSGNITGHNLHSTGIITATSFVGPVTGNASSATVATNAQGLTGSPSITVANITATGNVSIGGTLTYEDVTNVDSVGLITARGGISVTGGELNIETTGAIGLPTGTSNQRPSPPQAGQIRYNNENQQFEGYSTAWGGFGGASGSSGNAVFYENDTNVTASYSITSGKNAMSAGPITLNANIIVTIPAGSVWTVV
jgi:hypothetical protein